MNTTVIVIQETQEAPLAEKPGNVTLASFVCLNDSVTLEYNPIRHDFLVVPNLKRNPTVEIHESLASAKTQFDEHVKYLQSLHTADSLSAHIWAHVH